ncbi:MAG: GNAT family N-acetyltransferase [Myxococcales bacterium]|nr:GNAT family N-acetyltransferase [Myxococcales bacterium]
MLALLSVYAAKGCPGDARPGLRIRDAADTDFNDLLQLWRELMAVHVENDERFTLADDCDRQFFHYIETARSRDDYRVRVAVQNHHVVGFIICCILPNSPLYRTRWIGYINDISVGKSVRGQGVGTALVKDAVAWMSCQGAESIEVYVAKANTQALNFWRSMGGKDYLERISLDLTDFD